MLSLVITLSRIQGDNCATMKLHIFLVYLRYIYLSHKQTRMIIEDILTESPDDNDNGINLL